MGNIVEDPRDQLVRQLLNISKLKKMQKELEGALFPKGITSGKKEASDLSSMQEIIPLKEGEVLSRFMGCVKN